MKTTTRIVSDLNFPEGPRPFGDGLIFSDFYQHAVLALDATGSLAKVCSVEQQPSGLGFDPDGNLLIVSMKDRCLLRLPAAALSDTRSSSPGPSVAEGLPAARPEPFADLSGLAPSLCNDMVVDAQGRAYVGNFGFERHKGEEPRETCLIRVDPDGAMKAAATGLRFPNGTVITPDGTRLVVAESWGRRLTAFDVDESGDLHNRRVWADLGDRVPDGICLDQEGAIWVADPRNGGVFRVHEGGHVSEEIETPGHKAFACMLAGESRKTLYVCTAKFSGPQAEAERTGGIEIVEVAVAGAGLP